MGLSALAFSKWSTHCSIRTSGRDLLRAILSLAKRLNWFNLNFSFFSSSSSFGIATPLPFSPGHDLGFGFKIYGAQLHVFQRVASKSNLPIGVQAFSCWLVYGGRGRSKLCAWGRGSFSLVRESKVGIFLKTFCCLPPMQFSPSPERLQSV